MATTVAGIALNENIVWTNRNQYSEIVQAHQRTVGGAFIVWEKQLSKGRTITLVAMQDQGWLTQAQVDSLQSIANTPGSEFDITIGDFTARAVFDHSSGPAFTAVPFVYTNDTGVEMYYTGTIKLVTV